MKMAWDDMSRTLILAVVLLTADGYPSLLARRCRATTLAPGAPPQQNPNSFPGNTPLIMTGATIMSNPTAAQQTVTLASARFGSGPVLCTPGGQFSFPIAIPAFFSGVNYAIQVRGVLPGVPGSVTDAGFGSSPPCNSTAGVYGCIVCGGSTLANIASGTVSGSCVTQCVLARGGFASQYGIVSLTPLQQVNVLSDPNAPNPCVSATPPQTTRGALVPSVSPTTPSSTVPATPCRPSPPQTITSYTGILMPIACWEHSLHTGHANDGTNVQTHAEDHTVGCIKGCASGGYYVLRQDCVRHTLAQQYCGYAIKYKLNAAGNARANSLLAVTHKTRNYVVTVSGSWNGCVLATTGMVEVNTPTPSASNPSASNLNPGSHAHAGPDTPPTSQHNGEHKHAKVPWVILLIIIGSLTPALCGLGYHVTTQCQDKDGPAPKEDYALMYNPSNDDEYDPPPKDVNVISMH